MGGECMGRALETSERPAQPEQPLRKQEKRGRRTHTIGWGGGSTPTSVSLRSSESIASSSTPRPSAGEAHAASTRGAK